MDGRPRLEESQPAKRIVLIQFEVQKKRRKKKKKEPPIVSSTSKDVGETNSINREINNRREKLIDIYFLS